MLIPLRSTCIHSTALGKSEGEWFTFKSTNWQHILLLKRWDWSIGVSLCSSPRHCSGGLRMTHIRTASPVLTEWNDYLCPTLELVIIWYSIHNQCNSLLSSPTGSCSWHQHCSTSYTTKASEQKKLCRIRCTVWHTNKGLMWTSVDCMHPCWRRQWSLALRMQDMHAAAPKMQWI